ncbi:hypothetical protein MK079_01860 [Candidatus Gracilibacteria bacterium]|nr:hypothetical protein [Candidatus Gracilibacteria bacterium]
MSNILQQIGGKSDETITFLMDLGLTKNEVDIYLAALSMGQTHASHLGNKTGIKRSTAQHVCKSLVEKKMMARIKKDSGYLVWAESPEKILRNLKTEEQEIKKKKQKAEYIVENLNAVINPNSSIPEIKYYHGIDGIKEILDDIILTGETIYGVLRITKNTNFEALKYTLDTYHQKRVEGNLKSYGIINENVETKEYVKYKNELNRIVMVVPEHEFLFKGSVHIYGNKVAFFSFEKNDLVGVIVQDDHIRDTQFTLFKMAWEFAKKYEFNSHNKTESL